MQRVLFSQKIKAKIEQRRGGTRFVSIEPFAGYFFNNLSVRGRSSETVICVRHCSTKINTVSVFKALLEKLSTTDTRNSYKK